MKCKYALLKLRRGTNIVNRNVHTAYFGAFWPDILTNLGPTIIQKYLRQTLVFM